MNEALEFGIKFGIAWVVTALIVWGIYTVFPLHPAYILGIGYIAGFTASFIISDNQRQQKKSSGLRPDFFTNTQQKD